MLTVAKFNASIWLDSQSQTRLIKHCEALSSTPAQCLECLHSHVYQSQIFADHCVCTLDYLIGSRYLLPTAFQKFF